MASIFPKNLSDELEGQLASVSAAAPQPSPPSTPTLTTSPSRVRSFFKTSSSFHSLSNNNPSLNLSKAISTSSVNISLSTKSNLSHLPPLVRANSNPHQVIPSASLPSFHSTNPVITTSSVTSISSYSTHTNPVLPTSSLSSFSTPPHRNPVINAASINSFHSATHSHTTLPTISPFQMSGSPLQPVQSFISAAQMRGIVPLYFRPNIITKSESYNDIASIELSRIPSGSKLHKSSSRRSPLNSARSLGKKLQISIPSTPVSHDSFTPPALTTCPSIYSLPPIVPTTPRDGSPPKPKPEGILYVLRIC